MTEDNAALDEAHFRQRIEDLFASTRDVDSAGALRFIASYCKYLADGIDHRKTQITVPPDLLGSFESVYLWLSDLMKGYPDTVRNQIDAIVSGQSLCERFARLASVSAVDLKNHRLGRAMRRLPSIFSVMLPVRASDSDDEFFSSRELFVVKTSLSRLSQVLVFASSIQIVDYNEPLLAAKEHFDPELIDKGRLSGLLAILRIQAGDLSNASDRSRILETVDRLEVEIKRPRVRWGIVISSAFVLFGFLADLRTINPDAYEAVHRTAEAIVGVLYREAQVQHATGNRLGKESPENEDSSTQTQFPLIGRPPKFDSEAKDDTDESSGGH